MQTGLIECVPNVSEGRDRRVIQALGDAIEAAGAQLIDVHSDVDHHRSVFTYLGLSEVVELATLALARTAVQLIDLTKHRGAHPRVGAIDVIPFVPLCGATMDGAGAAAHRVGRAFAEETGVPVFLYGEAATSESRRELPALRRGGFEQLSERMCHPEWRPDAGPSAPHPTAGATLIGARTLLIAFNSVLESDDVALAKAIAVVVRESSGGLPAVRAMGVSLASRGLVQVSMNLLNYRRTPVSVVAERIEGETRRRGTRVLEYELVGCSPAEVFNQWPSHLAPIAGLKPSQLLDRALFAPVTL